MIPVYPEDKIVPLSEVPDQFHDWGEEWDSDHHGGYVCKVCGESSACISCNKKWKDDTGCLRNQIEEGNRILIKTYNDELQKYNHQAEYYNEVVRPYFL